MDDAWIEVPGAAGLAAEDVLRFDHGGRTFALYRDDKGGWFASDGLCTHEQVHLADGFVIGHTIECPRHQGRFDVRTGRALGAPVCVDLCTHPVTVEDGRVFVRLG
jgi:3-phenylpropionate/trans-cinnamate dioxygenase ferredoxin subunit